MSSAWRTYLSLPVVSDQIPTVQDMETIIRTLLCCFSQVKQRLPHQNDNEAQVNQKACEFHGDIKRVRCFCPSRASRTEAAATAEEARRRIRGEATARKLLTILLSYVRDALDKLRKITDSVSKLIKTFFMRSKIAGLLDSMQTPGATHSNSEKTQVQLSEIAYIVTKTKLKHQLPPPAHKILSSTSDSHRSTQVVDELGNYKEMPDMAEERKFLGSFGL